MSSATGVTPPVSTEWGNTFHRFNQPTAIETLPRGLARLVSWPDVSELPDELVGITIRICALLWRKSTASYLIAHSIGADPVTTAAMLRVLESRGHVDLMAVKQGDGNCAAEPAPPVEPAAGGQRASFIGKLWKRLLG